MRKLRSNVRRLTAGGVVLWLMTLAATEIMAPQLVAASDDDCGNGEGVCEVDGEGEYLCIGWILKFCKKNRTTYFPPEACEPEGGLYGPDEDPCPEDSEDSED